MHLKYSIRTLASSLTYYGQRAWIGGISDSHHACISSCIAAIFAAISLLSPPTPTSAKNWIDGTGNWNLAGNWVPTGVPTAGGAVNIVFTDGVARTVTLDVSPPSLGLLSVDLTGTGTAVSTLSAPNNNTLSANGILIGGYNGSTTTAGRGAMTQSDGMVSTNSGWDFVLGHGANSTGAYTLSGTGKLTANQSEYIGLTGNGTFNHSAGTNTIAPSNAFFILGTNVGSTGTYNLSGTGALVSNIDEYIGYTGTGVFNQNGGTNTMAGGGLYLGFKAGGSGGTYTLSAGTLSANGVSAVGFASAGTFNQSGGTVAISGDFRLGFQATATGTYTLGGGSLTVGDEIVGSAGQGNFVQTGGTNTASFYIQIARIPNSSGTYTLSGGLMTVPDGPIYVGGAGPLALGGAGILNVGGTGTLTAGTLAITPTPGTAVNFSGGTTNVAALDFNGDPARFNWTAGTLNVTSDVTWDSAAAGDTTGAAFGSALAVGATQAFAVTGNETLGGTGPFGLTLNSGSTHNVTGTLTIAANGTLSVNAGSALSVPTITQAGGTVNGTLVNQTAFVYQTGLFNGRLVNQGAVSFGASFTAGNGIENDTTITVGAGQTLTTNGAGFDNHALFTLSGGTLNASSVVNESGAYLVVAGAVSAGSVVNNGDLVVINTAIGGPLVNNRAVTVVGSVDFNGLVSGPGGFFGPGTAHFNGGLAPGASPAAVSFEGSLALAESNTLFIEIGGSTPGSEFDRLTIAGAASLDGTLQVSLLNNFMPAAGNAFDILDWGTLSGTFSTIQLPTLGGGLAWNTSQLYTNGVLSVVSAGVPGDYNNNGVVDAADYVVWRDNQGTANTLPNDPLGGTIGAAQYNQWRAHFGQSAGSGSSLGANSSAVPEPAAIAMLAIAMSTLTLAARRSKT